MTSASRRPPLLTLVTQFRADLQHRGTLPQTSLDGHLPAHSLQAAQSLLPLEEALGTGAPITTDIISAVFRAFYRANELVQLTPGELATFSAIECTVRQLGADT